MATPLDDLLAAHRDLGAATRALAATVAAGGRPPRRRARTVSRALLAQLAAEERAVFPALARADPTFDPAALIADHAELAAVARALRHDPSEAIRLARLVELHHADEQAILLPRAEHLATIHGRCLAPSVDRWIRRGR